MPTARRRRLRSVTTAAGRAFRNAVIETWLAPPKWISRTSYLGPRPATRQGLLRPRLRFAFRRPFIRPSVEVNTGWTAGRRFTPARKSLEAVYGRKPVVFRFEVPLSRPPGAVSVCQKRAQRRAAVFAAGAGGARGKAYARMMRGAQHQAESGYSCR